MSPEERNAIISRPWTYEEAKAALVCIRTLEKEGSWGENPPTPAMVELAEAVLNRPVGIVPFIRAKIIDAYEARIQELEAPK